VWGWRKGVSCLVWSWGWGSHQAGQLRCWVGNLQGETLGMTLEGGPFLGLSCLGEAC